MPTNLAIDDKLIDEARQLGGKRLKKPLLRKLLRSIYNGTSR